jgi:hypothetical protein
MVVTMVHSSKGDRTSLIGAVVAGVAALVDEQEGSQERPFGKGGFGPAGCSDVSRQIEGWVHIRVQSRYEQRARWGVGKAKPSPRMARIRPASRDAALASSQIEKLSERRASYDKIKKEAKKKSHRIIREIFNLDRPAQGRDVDAGTARAETARASLLFLVGDAGGDGDGRRGDGGPTGGEVGRGGSRGDAGRGNGAGGRHGSRSCGGGKWWWWWWRRWWWLGRGFAGRWRVAAATRRGDDEVFFF